MLVCEDTYTWMSQRHDLATETQKAQNFSQRRGVL